MVLTIKQAQDFKHGKLNKNLFNKLIGCDDINDYLYRYCKIIKDTKVETKHGFARTTLFKVYNLIVTLDYFNGECIGKKWVEVN